ncbi:hypothetical protein RC1_3399 [Rhodospirillum centenum SW]|uniref:Uncharacterized protein n=1 Tax=Rhodospirillum centenum (strain ATCC 51521 / SW) TaxID=414684 RepID=B6IWT5_RHOCS|nr:hypothetical protein RC1_3399 [Rhodospirillum centenum SW]
MRGNEQKRHGSKPLAEEHVTAYPTRGRNGKPLPAGVGRGPIRADTALLSWLRSEPEPDRCRQRRTPPGRPAGFKAA